MIDSFVPRLFLTDWGKGTATRASKKRRNLLMRITVVSMDDDLS
jgi:hypothetical protein